jgi:hypothetical protein
VLASTILSRCFAAFLIDGGQFASECRSLRRRRATIGHDAGVHPPGTSEGLAPSRGGPDRWRGRSRANAAHSAGDERRSATMPGYIPPERAKVSRDPAAFLTDGVAGRERMPLTSPETSDDRPRCRGTSPRNERRSRAIPRRSGATAGRSRADAAHSAKDVRRRHGEKSGSPPIRAEARAERGSGSDSRPLPPPSYARCGGLRQAPDRVAHSPPHVKNATRGRFER